MNLGTGTIAREELAAQQVVMTYYQRVDSKSALLRELFHPEVVYKRPGYERMESIAALRQFHRDERMIAEGRHTIRALFTSGSRVAVEGTSRGELRDGRVVELRFTTSSNWLSRTEPS